MPYIQIRSNKQINNESMINIKTRLGNNINILGKSESWLMVEIVPDCNLFFKGQNNEDYAYVDVNLCGSSSKESYNNMTKEITNMLNEYLNINPLNIYVSYKEYDNWGWNGNNF